MIYRSNGLLKTYCVTFPRSGHHLLMRGLHTALPGELVYSEFYKSAQNFENCEFVNFQKDHDLELKHEKNENYQYVIQVRSQEHALKSWYKLQVEHENQKRSWSEWLPDAQHFTSEWWEKWVFNPPKNSIIVPYETLVASPQFILEKVLSHIGAPPLPEDRRRHIEKWAKSESAWK